MKQIPIGNKDIFIQVDDEDYEKVSSLNLYITPLGYVHTIIKVGTKWKSKVIHAFILDTDNPVDHIDRNKLNNQKSNLRECSYQENRFNTVKINAKTSSKYKGVYWASTTNKWIANIKFNYKSVHLITTDNQQIAAACYNIAAELLMKEFAYLNPIENYDELKSIWTPKIKRILYRKFPQYMERVATLAKT